MKEEKKETKSIDLEKITEIFNKYLIHFKEAEAEATEKRFEARGGQKALLGVVQEINTTLGEGNVKEEKESQEGSNNPDPASSDQQSLRAVPGDNGDTPADKSSVAKSDRKGEYE